MSDIEKYIKKRKSADLKFGRYRLVRATPSPSPDLQFEALAAHWLPAYGL